jgi:hypothetical protein
LPSLIFLIKAKACTILAHLALATYIRLGRKDLSGASALAFWLVRWRRRKKFYTTCSRSSSRRDRKTFVSVWGLHYTHCQMAPSLLVHFIRI